MDALRGNEYEPLDLTDADAEAATEHDEPMMAIEPPPPVFAADERRMQVRAYNYWAGLLGSRRFPSPEHLLAGEWPEFAANAVLLSLVGGIEDPVIVSLGTALAEQAELDPSDTRKLSQVPGRSVVSRLTDHYLQIVANEAPIGFEAEFTNQRGATLLYRGILLPFSGDDETIDHIYGVINWKELADQRTTDELMLEIGQALGIHPIAGLDDSTDTDDQIDPEPDQWADGPALDLARIEAEEPAEYRPLPRLASEPGAAEPASLGEWLEKARASALRARASDDRTRQALYAAIGRAWDFALAAEEEPTEFARLLAEAGLQAQERAPLLPLIKLVFGADYDKTRLTEYATVLCYARRLGLERGTLADFLADAPGGLKAAIAAERAHKRSETPPTRKSSRWADRARALPVRPLTELSPEGAEFTLVMVRRLDDGTPALLGEIADDDALLARAIRHIAA